MNKTEMAMLRRALGLSLLDHVENAEIRSRLGVAPISCKIVEARLRWFGHVKRMPSDSVAHSALEMPLPGTRPRGKPKQRWTDNIRNDLLGAGLSPEDATDRNEWRRRTRYADPVF